MVCMKISFHWLIFKLDHLIPSLPFSLDDGEDGEHEETESSKAEVPWRKVNMADEVSETLVNTPFSNTLMRSKVRMLLLQEQWWKNKLLF